MVKQDATSPSTPPSSPSPLHISLGQPFVFHVLTKLKCLSIQRSDDQVALAEPTVGIARKAHCEQSVASCEDGTASTQSSNICEICNRLRRAGQAGSFFSCFFACDLAFANFHGVGRECPPQS